jgi:putative spermidine/putrescine transport system permease protein
MTRTAHQSFDAGLLIIPAFALLILLFVIPLAWFFVGVFAEEEGVSAVMHRFIDVLSAPGIVNALITTNWISAMVTALTLVIGYPIAYYLANNTGWRFALVLFCIIVPYFTSVIVRTYSWMVLLGRNGTINQALLSLGVIDAPLPLLYNKMGVLIGMTYVLLPYMVLTLYATMRGIDSNLVRAAYGLGASPVYTFRKVYFPLSLHGVVSGSLIVFILAIGFFITPALMGGPSDVMIAMLIERAVEITLDWTSAAIMSVALLAMTLVLYVIYYRVTDVRRMMGA